MVLGAKFNEGTNFSGHYTFLNIYENLTNLVSLESHGRVEYCNGNYFEKKKN